MLDELELFLANVQELDAYAFAEHVSCVAQQIASISDLDAKFSAVRALQRVIELYPYRCDRDAAQAIREQLRVIEAALK